MTAKYIHLPYNAHFSEQQIEDIINMANDPFCPETMTPYLVHLAVKSGEYIRNSKVDIVDKDRAELISRAVAALRLTDYSSDSQLANELERAFGLEE